MPGMVVGAGDSTVNKKDKILPEGADILVGTDTLDK